MKWSSPFLIFGELPSLFAFPQLLIGRWLEFSTGAGSRGLVAAVAVAHKLVCMLVFAVAALADPDWFVYGRHRFTWSARR
jgi:hypothetical protein